MNTEKLIERVQYNRGNNISSVGFIFACPGQKEQVAQKVVAGSTGKNLDLLLSYLSKSSNSFINSLFPSHNRYDYLITNASDIIHYQAWDGRSLPAKKEYMTSKNIERLCEELSELTFVIAFGVQAKEVAGAVEKAYQNGGVSHRPIFITSLPHLSFLSLNQISLDVNEEPIPRGEKDGTRKRIEVVKKQLEKQILSIERKD